VEQQGYIEIPRLITTIVFLWSWIIYQKSGTIYSLCWKMLRHSTVIVSFQKSQEIIEEKVSISVAEWGQALQTSGCLSLLQTAFGGFWKHWLDPFKYRGWVDNLSAVKLRKYTGFILWCKEIWKGQIHRSKVILWYNF